MARESTASDCGTWRGGLRFRAVQPQDKVLVVPSFSDHESRGALREIGLKYECPPDIGRTIAELLVPGIAHLRDEWSTARGQ